MSADNDGREAGGTGLQWGQPYAGSDMVVAQMSRGARLSQVLGALGYDLRQTCFTGRRLVICRETRGVEFDGEALACWRWLLETGLLADYVATQHRRHRMNAAQCRPKNNQLRLFR